MSLAKKPSRNVIQTDVADNTQLVRLFRKSRDCEVVVELITVPGNFLGLGAYRQISMNAFQTTKMAVLRF